MARFVFNESVTHDAVGTGSSRAPLAFHKRLPGYEPTPLCHLPKSAQRLGIGELLVKDESSRLGLPAFKILGASWAVYRTTVRLLGHEPQDWSTFDELRRRFEPLSTVGASYRHGRQPRARSRPSGGAVWL